MTHSLVYKIRNKNTGLFSNGKKRPRFDKVGHAWGSLQDVKRHVETGVNVFRSDVEVHEDFLPYRNCEIVEYLLTGTPIDETPTAIINRKIEKEAATRTDYYGVVVTRFL